MTSCLSENKPCTIIIKTEKRENSSPTETPVKRETPSLPETPVKSETCAIVNEKNPESSGSENSTKGSVKLKLNLDTSHNSTSEQKSDKTVSDCSIVAEECAIGASGTEPVKMETDEVKETVNNGKSDSGDIEMKDLENTSTDDGASATVNQEHSDQNISSNSKTVTDVVDPDSVNHHKSSKIKLYEKWSNEKKKLEKPDTSVEEFTDSSKNVPESNDKSNSVLSNKQNYPGPTQDAAKQSTNDKDSALEHQKINSELETAVDLSTSSRTNVIVQNVSSNKVPSDSKSDAESAEGDACTNSLTSSKSKAEKNSEFVDKSPEKFGAHKKELDKFYKRNQIISECFDASVITNSKPSSGFSHLQALQNMCETNLMGGIPSVIQSTHHHTTEPSRAVTNEDKLVTNNNMHYDNTSKKCNFNDIHSSNSRNSINGIETTNVLLKSNVHSVSNENKDKQESGEPINKNHSPNLKESVNKKETPDKSQSVSDEPPNQSIIKPIGSGSESDINDSVGKTETSLVIKEHPSVLKTITEIDKENLKCSLKEPNLTLKENLDVSKGPSSGTGDCDSPEKSDINLSDSSQNKSLLDDSVKSKESDVGKSLGDTCSENNSKHSNQSAIDCDETNPSRKDSSSKSSDLEEDPDSSKKKSSDSSLIEESTSKSESAKSPDNILDHADETISVASESCKPSSETEKKSLSVENNSHSDSLTNLVDKSDSKPPADLKQSENKTDSESDKSKEKAVSEPEICHDSNKSKPEPVEMKDSSNSSECKQISGEFPCKVEESNTAIDSVSNESEGSIQSGAKEAENHGDSTVDSKIQESEQAAGKPSGESEESVQSGAKDAENHGDSIKNGETKESEKSSDILPNNLKESDKTDYSLSNAPKEDTVREIKESEKALDSPSDEPKTDESIEVKEAIESDESKEFDPEPPVLRSSNSFDSLSNELKPHLNSSEISNSPPPLTPDLKPLEKENASVESARESSNDNADNETTVNDCSNEKLKIIIDKVDETKTSDANEKDEKKEKSKGEKKEKSNDEKKEKSNDEKKKSKRKHPNENLNENDDSLIQPSKSQVSELKSSSEKHIEISEAKESLEEESSLDKTIKEMDDPGSDIVKNCKKSDKNSKSGRSKKKDEYNFCKGKSVEVKETDSNKKKVIEENSLDKTEHIAMSENSSEKANVEGDCEKTADVQSEAEINAISVDDDEDNLKNYANKIPSEEKCLEEGSNKSSGDTKLDDSCIKEGDSETQIDVETTNDSKSKAAKKKESRRTTARRNPRRTKSTCEEVGIPEVENAKDSETSNSKDAIVSTENEVPKRKSKPSLGNVSESLKSVLSSTNNYDVQFKVYNLRHGICSDTKCKHPMCDKYVKSEFSVDLTNVPENLSKARSKTKKKPSPAKKPQPAPKPQTPVKKTPPPKIRNRKKEEPKKEDFTIPEGFLEILDKASVKGAAAKKRKGIELQEAVESNNNSEDESTPRKRSRRIREAHQKKMTELAVEMEREQRRLEQMARSNKKKSVPPPTPERVNICFLFYYLIISSITVLQGEFKLFSNLSQDVYVNLLLPFNFVSDDARVIFKKKCSFILNALSSEWY